ncbi:MAG: lamin tail domain-containing protein [Saprospiraceae bacterium]
MRKLIYLLSTSLFCLQLHAQVIINEINYNPPEAGQDLLEYLELYNSGANDVNLKNWYIDNGVNMLFPDTTLKGFGYLVICVNQESFDTAYGFKALQWINGALRNDSEILTLKDSSGVAIDSVRYSDSNGWPSGPDGNGPSLELCRPEVDNYRSEYWKPSTTLIGKKVNGMDLRGTPGKANNVQCADVNVIVKNYSFTPSNFEIYVGQHVEWKNLSGTHNVNGSLQKYPNNPEGFTSGNPQSGDWTYIKRFDKEGDYNYSDDLNTTTMNGIIKVRKIDINYPSYPISKIKTINANGDLDSIGTRCTLDGVVYGINFRPAGLQFTIIDEFNDGISVFSSAKNFAYTVKEGDKVRVKGNIAQLNGLAEILVDTVYVVSKNVGLVNPTIVTTLNEASESQLVKIKNVYLVAPLQWTKSPLGFTVKMSDGTNTFDVRIDNDCELISKEAPAGKFDLTGIGFQNDLSAPYLDGYQIYPRYSADINPYLPANKYYNKLDIINVKGVNSNGELDSIKVRCELRGTVYGIDNDGTSGLLFTLIDKTAGITVYSSLKSHNYKVTEGDEIIVQGVVDQFMGQAEIIPDTVVLITEKNPLKSPKLVTKLEENLESDLIRINDLSIVDISEWTGNGNSFNVRLTNGTTEFLMHIDNDCDLSKTTAKSLKLSVTGIENQFDNLTPFTEGYQIWPRYSADVTFTTDLKDEYTKENILLFPNPAQDYFEIKNATKNYTQVQIINSEGKMLKEVPYSTRVSCPFPRGLYFVRLIHDGGMTSLKLNIQ